MGDIDKDALTKAEEAIQRVIDLNSEIYSDAQVLVELARLTQHTRDEVQSRIQAVYRWMRERNSEAK